MDKCCCCIPVLFGFRLLTIYVCIQFCFSILWSVEVFGWPLWYSMWRMTLVIDNFLAGTLYLFWFLSTYSRKKTRFQKNAIIYAIFIDMIMNVVEYAFYLVAQNLESEQIREYMKEYEFIEGLSVDDKINLEFIIVSSSVVLAFFLQIYYLCKAWKYV